MVRKTLHNSFDTLKQKTDRSINLFVQSFDWKLAKCGMIPRFSIRGVNNFSLHSGAFWSILEHSGATQKGHDCSRGAG